MKNEENEGEERGLISHLWSVCGIRDCVVCSIVQIRTIGERACANTKHVCKPPQRRDIEHHSVGRAELVRCAPSVSYYSPRAVSRHGQLDYTNQMVPAFGLCQQEPISSDKPAKYCCGLGCNNAREHVVSWQCELNSTDIMVYCLYWEHADVNRR